MDSKWAYILIGFPLLFLYYKLDDSYDEKKAAGLKLLNSEFTSVQWDEDRGHDFIHPCSRDVHFDFKAVKKERLVSGIVCCPMHRKPRYYLD